MQGGFISRKGAMAAANLAAKEFSRAPRLPLLFFARGDRALLLHYFCCASVFFFVRADRPSLSYRWRQALANRALAGSLRRSLNCYDVGTAPKLEATLAN